MISSTRNEEMSSETDEMEAELQCRRQAGFSLCIAKFRKDCENFATIAKISQSLLKFGYAQFFAKLAKFRYHRENSLS